MRGLGVLTAVFAVLLVGAVGLPSYAPASLRTLVAAFAVLGFGGGLLLALGQTLGGWSRWLALAFCVAVLVFGLLLLVQAALLSQTLGAALRYQLFSSVPAGLLAVFLLRGSPRS